MSRRPTMMSGIAPSGRLTLGNYLGAIRSWTRSQGAYDCYFVLVDLHAITVRQDPATFAERCRDFVALYVACGIDPAGSAVFVQSHVPEHCELAWVLQCHTSVGELGRMTQFKHKSRRNDVNANAGLFSYPVLMAADVLLYQTEAVPVGDDQRQHLELTRNLARRFNELYGPTFKVPEALVPEVGARIMGLQDPTRKMSKSDPADTNLIALLDPPDVIDRKIQRSVTDSGREVVARREKPGITNLLNILAATTGTPVSELESRYTSQSYRVFKRDVADAVIGALTPIQQRYGAIRSEPSVLDDALATGARRARLRAGETLARVHHALGLLPRS